MAEKPQAAQVSKGPPMLQVMHDGSPVWANKTGKGLYRCVICKSESHDKAPQKK